MYWTVRVRYTCMFALRVEMRRNYRRGKERRGWSSHKRSHHPHRHRRASHSSRAQRQVRAQRGFSAGSAAAACAWLNVQNRDSLELRGLPPEDLVDNTSGVSVIPTGSGIALISGSLLCVHDGTLMLDWDAAPWGSPCSSALCINPSSTCKDSSGKKNTITSF